ncbi:MAG: DUF2207 domain-containing protein [Oscillospiraceae bacterium]|nr:DUF2207 domain-containing protein [Oscillospiraceae bacterium]MBR7009951.1 DUF2207 domain-containing protein [Oscillospiraceae bacterium]
MRKLFLAAAALLMLLLLTTAVSAEGTTVTEMKTECAVENDGACTLTLSFTVEFGGDAGDFTVPVSASARELSCSAPYTRKGGEGCDLLVLTGPWSGKQSFTVSYRLAETVTDDGRLQKLSVRLLYPAWTCPIAGYRVRISLPGQFETMPVFFSGYYGELIDNYMKIEIDRAGSIDAVLDARQTLRDRESMTLELELPEGYFDLRFLAGKTVRVDRVLFLGLLALALLYWLIFLRNLPILPKRQAMPPEGGNAGEIPYVLTDRKPDLALMVIQWASLGYLTVSRTKRGNIWLTRQIDMDTERKRYEVEIFDTLFARDEHCDLRSAEYLKARRLCGEKTREFWRDRVYDPRAGAPWILRLLALGAGLALCLACFDLWVASKSWRWFLIVPMTLLGGLACLAVQELGGFLLRRHSLRTAILGLLSAAFLLILGRRGGLSALSLLNLALQLAVGLLLRCGGRRTAEGAALASELLGYRRWLLSASAEQLQSNLAADPQYFYRVLPFADALCAGRMVAATLDRVRMEECGWLLWQGKPCYTAPAFYARYRRLMAGLRGERDPAARPRPEQRQQRQVSTRVTPPRRSPGERRPPSREAARRSAAQARGNKARAHDVQRRPRP